MRFADKRAIVTGAGAGIGRAIAKQLAAEGAVVLVFDIDASGAEATVADLTTTGARALAVAGDVTDPTAIDGALGAATEAWGGLDILVNNAAFTIKGSLEQTAPADWTREIDICLKGPYLCAKAVLPDMVARGAGAIVNIASVNGLIALGNPAYSAAKAGLIHFTKSLAVEYGPSGIRTNTVCPGTVRTEAPTWRIRQQKDPQVFAKLARWYPVGRVGTPEDIAAAVAFLASDEASFVNGANLVVDGGLTAGMGVMIEELTLETEA